MPPALARDSFGAQLRSTPSSQLTRRTDGEPHFTYILYLYLVLVISCSCFGLHFGLCERATWHTWHKLDGTSPPPIVPLGSVWQTSFASVYPTGTLTHIHITDCASYVLNSTFHQHTRHSSVSL